jgi:RNase P subunit RPR2
VSKDIPKRKEQDLKKTIRQLKAKVLQERKARELAEAEIVRLRDALDDVEIVDAAKKLARDKRKRKALCKSCGAYAVETQRTRLGVKDMLVSECGECGYFERTFEEN